MPPRALILRAPGTNCDEETAFAFTQAGALAESVHINRWLDQPALSDAFQILCIPGGFSYGDDVAAGRIFANQIRNHLADRALDFREQEKLVLGICNGFQVLLKSGLLLPEDATGAHATLSWNESAKFEDRWVNLKVQSKHCVFLSGIERMELPVAHAEGRFVTQDQATLERLEASGQLALRFAPRASDGEQDEVPYPDNPNGSMANVAGVCDESGHVFGLMPHPERYLDSTQHPAWTDGRDDREVDGLRIFRNAVRFFQ